MKHKRWSAVHDRIMGWHAALVDVAPPKPEKSAMGVSIEMAVMAMSVFGVAPTLAALAQLEAETGA
jgi:hypothetical protein